MCEGYSTVPQSISTAIHLLDDEERRGFLYFKARTVCKIFGQRDASDWIPILLHFGHAEPAVKHSIIALASLHESLEPASSMMFLRKPREYVTNTAQIVALKHYNKAIRFLRIEPLNMSSRPEILMILCILFICFEQFRSADAACVTHLMAGFKLLGWWRTLTSNYTKLRSFSKPTLDLINTKVTPVLQRLRVQFALCMDSRHEFKNVADLPYFPAPPIPSSYSSLDRARTDFDRAMNYAFCTLRHDQTNGTEFATQDVLGILGRWKSALDASSPFGQSSILQSYTHKLLDLYYHASVIIISTYATEVETIFDDYTPRFQSIIYLAEELVHYWKKTPQDYGLLFSFDLGITPPMFFVASRCRDSQIRRKAVDIMLESPYYHGAWQDQYSGLCAQRIVELEELGLENTGNGVYLPEHRRIRKVCADLQEDEDRIVMRYMYPPFTASTQVCTTFIEFST